MTVARANLHFLLRTHAEFPGLLETTRFVMREGAAALAGPDPAVAERQACAALVRRYPGLNEHQAEAIAAAIMARSNP